MAGSVNKAIIIGHLGRDPEIRVNDDGNPIATLSVATSDAWRDKESGERKERTSWHRIVVFNERLAEFADHHLKKGMKIYAEGSMQTRRWTDKQNIERYVTEVVLQRFRGELQALESIGGGGVPPVESPDDYGYESAAEG